MDTRRIFISGALNSNSVGFMKNMRRMLKVAHAVRKLNVRVYVPISDFLVSLVGDCLTHDEYYEVDLAELEFCDAIFLVPGYEESKGVSEERKRAREFGIPEFNCIKQLENWLEEIPEHSQTALQMFLDNHVHFTIRDRMKGEMEDWFRKFAHEHDVGLNEVVFVCTNMPHRPVTLEPKLIKDVASHGRC